MRVLVWQWGRRGAGPFYAATLARAFNQTGQAAALLSLSTSAELLQGQGPPPVALPVVTYAGFAGLAGRLLAAPATTPRLARWLRRERVDIALCAMPAATDMIMIAALRLAGIPYAVVIHDAALHPGDRFALQIQLQRWTMRGAAAVFALSQHVAEELRGTKVLRSSLPPFDFGAALPPPRAHGGKWRLLSFGRLLPYKGLDLLADALSLLGPRPDLDIRVVGSGPASAGLDRLRALPGVAVENRWVPEAELPALLGWSDALILSHREASQSGVAAAAIAAGRYVVATDVGGLAEQLGAVPGAILCPVTAEGLAAGIRTLLDGNARPPGPRGDAWPAVARTMLDDLERLIAPASPRLEQEPRGTNS